MRINDYVVLRDGALIRKNIVESKFILSDILKKAHYNLWEFNKALMTLKEAIDAGSLVKFAMDAATQRFEYSYELSWNLIKSVLKFKGIELRYPSELFSEAFSAGWITNIESWETMITDRNTLAHTYKRSIIH